MSGVLFAGACTAQCGTIISGFPYDESFEIAPTWTSGGTNSDWQWGTPAHPTVNGAAQGMNAWCVGGLTGSFYNNGQQSWLESPCFDISGLAYPWISFSIWWETERNYDGVGLQYSVDGGTTWTNLGSSGTATDCQTMNWFNSANITALNQASPRSGWSGTSTTGGCASGGGSNGYVTAAHCLLDVQSADPVKFRFIFGAGTVCNTFDGVAIDAVHIGEAPPLSADFTYTCAGSTVAFSATGNAGCVEQGTWGFGDPASGAGNTATGATATHTYPGPGTYSISFTMTGSCGAPVTVEHAVVIAGLSFDVVDVGCTPNSGSVTVGVDGGAGPFTYDWDPGGANTATIDGLAPGSYTVLVQAPGMCPLQGTAVVGQDGANIMATATPTDPSCNGTEDGAVSVLASGGTGIYTYAWAPSGGTGSTATGLGPGTYTCTVSDDAGCSTVVEATLMEPAPVVVDPVADVSLCAGESTLLAATANGGVGTLSFTWSPQGPEVAPSVTTDFDVVATDANGCASVPVQVTVNVVPVPEPAFTWDLAEGCAPLCVTFQQTSGGMGTRVWSFSDGATAGDAATVEHCFTQSGTFGASLTMSSPEGCEGMVDHDAIITVSPMPDASFSIEPAVPVLDGSPVVFTSTGSGDLARDWSFGDPGDGTATGAQVAFTYTEAGCFTVRLEVRNEYQCTHAAEELLCVEDPFALFAPNAFTPNADGINDVFGVVTSVVDPKEFSLLLYDRWGQVVHTSTDAHRGWDGGELPSGVYAWQLRLIDSQGELQQRQGHVVLVR